MVCQRALIDQSNNLSIVQVLEELGIPAPPPDKPVALGAIIPIALTVVSSWQRVDSDKAEKTRGRIRMIAPTGKIFGRAEFDIDLSVARRCRHLAEMGGMPYYGAGLYVIRFDLAVAKKWRNVGDTDFTLHHNMNIKVAPVSKAKH